MSDIKIEEAKEPDSVDNTPKDKVDDNSSKNDLKHSDIHEENPVHSLQEEEEIIKKKYGGMLPKKPPLISKEMLNSIHPPRSDWYEECYAFVLARFTKSYEAEVAKYKSQLFTKLRGNAETILEIGIGTGPNLEYYANGSSVYVLGMDPNQKMEKYAQRAAVAAGLPPTNFTFMQAVAEALPVNDASVDVVVGTLVLCSVKDVGLALKEVIRVLKPGGKYLFVEHVAARDGTILRSVQGFLNPLQKIVADRCHLTRTTGTNITEAGFSDVDINMAFLSSAWLVSPHIYGIACK